MTLTIGILIPFLGTTLGSAMVFLMRGNIINNKFEKLLLGFTSGIMIAASIWSLIIPAIEMAESQGKIGWLPTSLGFFLGVIFLLFLDKFLPKLYKDTASNTKNSKFKKTLMMVLAITLHNIPEGMAVRYYFCRCINWKYWNCSIRCIYISYWNCYSKLSRRCYCFNAIKTRWYDKF